MTEGKYDKLFITEPMMDSIYPPFKKFLLCNIEDNISFSIRFTHIIQPFEGQEPPHAHEFDEVFSWVPCSEDLTEFDAEVELYLGEEQEKYVINKTTVAHIPKGLVHCPIIYKRIGKPIFFVNCQMSAEYTQIGKDGKSRPLKPLPRPPQ